MELESILAKVDAKLIHSLTKTLVELDSQNPPGKTSHIAKFLAEEGKSLGFNTEIVPLDTHRHNVVLSFGEGKDSIVLSGHLDTVPVGDETKWRYPPLSLTERDGRFYGRGTVDMKGGVATLIAVMDALYHLDLPIQKKILFAGTADEEVGMHGAMLLNKKGYMSNAECLVITEATDLQVGIAEKGPLWVDIQVNGKAAHGSMPDQGVNAIYGACKVMLRLQEVLPRVEHELLGGSTLNIGVISGGTKINIVPEACKFKCDYRLIPEVDTELFVQELEELLEVISSREAFSVEMNVTHAIPALTTSKEEPLVQNFLTMANKLSTQQKSLIGLNYATDAAALIPPQNIPFVIFGPGDPALLHQTNEFVPVKDLVLATKAILGALITTYAPNELS